MEEETLEKMASCDFTQPLSITISYDSDEDALNNIPISDHNLKDNHSAQKRKKKPQESLGPLKINKKSLCNETGTSKSTPKCKKKKETSFETETENIVSFYFNKNEENNENIKAVEEIPFKENLANKTNVVNANTINDLQNIVAPIANDTTLKRNDLNLMDPNNMAVLKTVSENIIFSLHTHNEYVKKLNTYNHDINANNFRIAELRKFYNNKQKHLFGLSYCAVVNLMLEHEHNNDFISEFLDNTKKIAKTEMNLEYTKENLRLFYDKLIDFTKLQRENINKFRLSLSKQVQDTSIPNNHIRNSPLLVQRLNESPITPNLSTTKPVFSIDLSGIYQTSTSSLDSDTQKNNTIRYTPRSPFNNFPNPEMQLHHQNYPNLRLDNRGPLSSGAPNNHINNNQSLHEHFQMMQRQQPLQSQQLPYHQQQYYSPCQDPTMIPSRIPENVYHNNDRLYQNQIESVIQHVENPRSVSTDSGFVSPLQCIERIRSSLEYEPYITQVTSLNPNALYIEKGVCRVCGVQTKMKCMGCFTVYYCNNVCQKKDWTVHMDTCYAMMNKRETNNTLQKK